MAIIVRDDKGEYSVAQSSSHESKALTTPAWGKWQQAISEKGNGTGGQPSFWSNPIAAVSEGSQLAEKWSYYDTGRQDYWIGAHVVDPLALQYKTLLGPDSLLAAIINNHTLLLDMAVFELKEEVSSADAGSLAAGKAKQKAERIYGTFQHQSAADTQAMVSAAGGDAVLVDGDWDGKQVRKGFFRVQEIQDVYVVALAYDIDPMLGQIKQQRNTQLFFALLLLSVIILGSYMIADWLMRPISDVLRKVDEVANGRFGEPLEVTRKDEIGQLAQHINEMSINLSVYTSKLTQSFEQNRSMKEYLESFINHTTDAIHVMDLDGRLTQVNRAFEQMFGYAEDEAVGRELPLVPPHLLTEEQEALDWLISGRLLNTRETVRVTKSGEWIDVSVTTSPIRDQHGKLRALANITRDVTSRNKMEELLRRSEKLTTVGQLAAGVAHEIRNPLTTLRGFLQLHQEKGQLNPRHIDIMLSELDRINLIVGEFLILAKPQATRFEVKDVRFILGDVISLLDSQAHLCDIMFKMDYTSEVCQISCEENQLKQVFINILKNAMEAMPEGGEIEVQVKHAGPDKVSIAIIDQGTGIPSEMIPKLGDPFFTGKETGTGLGLMVSQRIIHSHHGMLDIQSEVDVGTVVTITLPLREERGIESPQEQAPQATIEERMRT
nr:HAMP domain-containing sensor histidine kinase [Paenibacillus phyllosphaerae]